MTEGDTVASFASKEVENLFVTLPDAVQLTIQTSAYIERLCRDGYVPCAGGSEGEIYPKLDELLKILNITLPIGTEVHFVPVSKIAYPQISRELLTKNNSEILDAVKGNQPVATIEGGDAVASPLRHNVLPFSFVPEQAADTVPMPTTSLDVTERAPLPEHWPLRTEQAVAEAFDESSHLPPLVAKEQKNIPDLPNTSTVDDQMLMMPPEMELAKPVPLGLGALIQDVLQKSEVSTVVSKVESELSTPREERVVEQYVEQKAVVAESSFGDVDTQVGGEQKIESEAGDIAAVSVAEVAPTDVPLEYVAPVTPLVESVIAATRPEVVISPVELPVAASVVDRIIEEAEQSRFATGAVAKIEEMEVPPAAQGPIIAVPHHPVRQMTPSLHELALPPQVVPFATQAPAAYPQAAAVFTQPQARASEWLPWMRTSHFTRREVVDTTKLEVYAQIGNAGKQRERIFDEMPTPPKEVAQPEQPVVTRTPVTYSAPQKVFVSVVKKTTAPIVNHVVVNELPGMTITKDTWKPISVPPAKDEWDEKLASQKMREGKVDPEPVKVTKTTKELIEEVKGEINDSWDASFLGGLDLTEIAI